MFDDVNYLKNQVVLRKRLLRIMKLSGQPIRHIAKEIGIVVSTLMTFMDGKDTDWVRLCLIEKYVLKYENYLGYNSKK